MSDGFDVGRTLPVQLCDVASLVVAWALWSQQRWATALAVGALDAALGTNDGHLTAKPCSASVLDLRGPWPLHLAREAALVAVGWALMVLPFARRSGGDARRRQVRQG